MAPVSLLKRIAFAIPVFTLFVVLTTHAATKTWIPGAGGTWTIAGNWSPSGQPAPGDSVIISSDLTGNITAVPSISLLALMINGSCDFESSASGNTFTITGTFSVASGKTLTLGNAGNRMNITITAAGRGTIAGSVNIVSGATHRTFTNNGDLSITAAGMITGTNSDFVQGSGATLRIASTAGISSSGATGNIRTGGTRTFSTSANYIYNGSSAQSCGNGLPATVGSLTISNSAGVTLDAGRTVSNALVISPSALANLGTYTHSSGTLILAGSGVASGSWGSTSSSAMNTNNTCFAAVSGIVNVTTGTCTSTTITLSSTNATVCAGVTSAQLAYSASTGSPDRYSIDYDANATSAGFVDVTNAVLSSSPIGLGIPGAGTAATYNGTLTVKNSATACESSAYPITVTINATSVGGTATPSSLTICTGSNADITLTGNTGAIVKWQHSSDNSTWSDIVSTANPYNTGALSATMYFRAVVQSGVCASANSSSALVAVDAASDGGSTAAATSTICAGSNTDITLSGNTGAIVKWERSSDNSTWSDIVSTSNPYNTGALSATTYFRAVVQSGVCASANSSSALVAVDAASDGGSTAASASTICAGSNTDITLSGNTGAIVKWQRSSDNSTWSDIVSTSNP